MLQENASSLCSCNLSPKEKGLSGELSCYEIETWTNSQEASEGLYFYDRILSAKICYENKDRQDVRKAERRLVLSPKICTVNGIPNLVQPLTSHLQAGYVLIEN